jgi:hypothetical protein
MANQPRHKAAWIRWLTGTALTVTFAVAVVWGARAWGRSIVFAFGVNWVLMMWAIMFASNVVPLRLPAQYYATRRFEKADACTTLWACVGTGEPCAVYCGP